MAIKERIRIISDLHLGHPSCSFDDPGELAPLFREVSTVIFNGDSVETQQKKHREAGLRNAELLKKICIEAGAEPCVINGNHDPQISSLNHADLADGSVLVTHGDMLFHGISPWNKRSTLIGKAHTEALEALGDDAFRDFEKRLRASKDAMVAIEMHEVPVRHGPLAKILFVLEEFWPPWRPLQIVKCWVETPGRAVALMRVFRPRARFIVIGHTHRAGIWRVGPRVVINTGSFMPFAGCRVVDIEGGEVSVKSVVRRGSEFVTGREVARFDAVKLNTSESY